MWPPAGATPVATGSPEEGAGALWLGKEEAEGAGGRLVHPAWPRGCGCRTGGCWGRRAGEGQRAGGLLTELWDSLLQMSSAAWV